MTKNCFLLLILVFGAFLLCGCDSSDYKKAVTADESDDFDIAIDLYSKLSKKNYKDSDSRLQMIRVRRELSRMDHGQWDAVDCRRLLTDRETADEMSGITDLWKQCYLEKADFFHENGGYQEAIDALQHVWAQAPIPEGYDISRMMFDNKFELCKTVESEDERFDCLGDTYEEEVYSPKYRYDRIWINKISSYLKEREVYYENPDISIPLFLRSIGMSGSFSGRRDFGTMMEQCLAYTEENRLSSWICIDDLLFDMVYFTEGEPAAAYLSAKEWAAANEQQEISDRLENVPQRCIGRPAESEFSGITYPIDAPAPCNAVFQPELYAWLRENSVNIVPAEGFWDSDSFYLNFPFEGTDTLHAGSQTIMSNFKADDPQPKTVSVIVSSYSELTLPGEKWRDHPEQTPEYITLVNRFAETFKKLNPDWVFTEDPSMAAYILYLDIRWEETGKFTGAASGKPVSVSVYNMLISGNCWTNRPGIRENTIYHVRTNLGKENSIQGISQDLVAQRLVIASEDPLTFYRAEYDPERGIAWPTERPSAYSSVLADWLIRQEEKFMSGK